MSELTKLETMYYHMREARHLRFLESNPSYAISRTLNTFKGGKPIIDTESMLLNQKSSNRGQTIVSWNKTKSGE